MLLLVTVRADLNHTLPRTTPNSLDIVLAWDLRISELDQAAFIAAKNTLSTVLSYLYPSDSVALLTFGPANRSITSLPASAANVAHIRTYIERARPVYSGNLDGVTDSAVEAAVEILDRHEPRKDVAQHLVVISAGLEKGHNVKVEVPPHVTVHAVKVGNEADASPLRKLCTIGTENGAYIRGNVSNMDAELRRTVEVMRSGAMAGILKNVGVELKGRGGIAIEDVLDVEGLRIARVQKSQTVEIGNMPLFDCRCLLFRLFLEDRQQDSTTSQRSQSGPSTSSGHSAGLKVKYTAQFSSPHMTPSVTRLAPNQYCFESSVSRLDFGTAAVSNPRVLQAYKSVHLRRAIASVRTALNAKVDREERIITAVVEIDRSVAELFTRGLQKEALQEFMLLKEHLTLAVNPPPPQNPSAHHTPQQVRQADIKSHMLVPVQKSPRSKSAPSPPPSRGTPVRSASTSQVDMQHVLPRTSAEADQQRASLPRTSSTSSASHQSHQLSAYPRRPHEIQRPGVAPSVNTDMHGSPRGSSYCFPGPQVDQLTTRADVGTLPAPVRPDFTTRRADSEPDPMDMPRLTRVTPVSAHARSHSMSPQRISTTPAQPSHLGQGHRRAESYAPPRGRSPVWEQSQGHIVAPADPLLEFDELLPRLVVPLSGIKPFSKARGSRLSTGGSAPSALQQEPITTTEDPFSDDQASEPSIPSHAETLPLAGVTTESPRREKKKTRDAVVSPQRQMENETDPALAIWKLLESDGLRQVETPVEPTSEGCWERAF
ncbi:hypothetical protein SAICODRAFT_8589 [Saitoella complicata NRRL Y-17804]|nr:uncharacterized protein SAICODRAFT_8589 [Saitoella complicata NRRL Y-17804]ODQ52012.1 hypothetical protein SAICODRAFT_8589 [Saitoella complicata NRRL Y-17804]